MNLEIKESFVNYTKGYRFGNTEWYEPFTNDLGTLYKSLRKEYGKCVSRVYVDELQVNGRMASVVCGWVFQKRMQYEDSKDTYIREVWVSYRTKEDARP